MRTSLRNWLSDGPFGLTMSSGFFGFFVHAGMLSTLLEAGLVPVRVSGSSAGALVAALWSAGLDLDALSAHLFRLERDSFWDPAPGLGWLRGERFRNLLQQYLPVQHFEQTRVPLAVSAFDPLRGTVVLDRGELAPAVHASCAVPVMFHPVRVEGRWLWDGGLTDRPGLCGMPTGQRVLYHHLSSRSPWRRAGSPALQIPRRANMVALSILAPPRPHPWAMHLGRQAFEVGRTRTRTALDSPLQDGVIQA